MIGKFTPLGIAIGLSMAASALAEPPQINAIAPFGAQRGVATDVTISGGNLTANPRLIAPFTVAVEPAAGGDAAHWKLKVNVEAGTPVGVYPVRVLTDDGISNPFLFAVGQVPRVAETEPNNSFETAQTVPMLVVVEGQVAGNDVDFFKFAGKKRQRIVDDAQCARIGSGVDPVIRLTTANRGFVASADDTAGLLTDARLTASCPKILITWSRSPTRATKAAAGRSTAWSSARCRWPTRSIHSADAVERPSTSSCAAAP